MPENPLQTARDLIDRQDFDGARALLETLPDDPTAQAWLLQLKRREQPEPSVYRPIDRYDERPVPAVREPINRGTWILVVLILFVLLNVLLSAYNRQQEATKQEWETFCSLQYERGTTQWQNCIEAQ